MQTHLIVLKYKVSNTINSKKFQLISLNFMTSSQKFTSGIPNLQLPHVDDQFNQPFFNFPAQPQQQAPRAYPLV
jgi:hypothetical protein